MSAFDAIKAAPPDKVFHTMTLFRADNHPNKLNLGIGAYRTDQGEPYVLPIVRSTELQLADCSGTGIKSKNMKQIHSVERMADFVLEACSDKGLNKEYLPIRGMAEFVSRSQILILGENSKALAENRVAGCQTIAGTGALRVGAEFIHRNLSDRSLYCSDPTWANHHEIFRGSSISVGPPYRY